MAAGAVKLLRRRLREALHAEDERELERLLASDARVARWRGCGGNTALHYATREGYRDLVTRLLRAGADPNARDHHELTPLTWAMLREDVEMLGELVRAGGDLHVRADRYGGALSYTTLLSHAVFVEALESVRFLLNAGCDPDNGEAALTPLLDVATSEKIGRLSVARLLVAAGANVNRGDEDGMTCLHHAFERGERSAVPLPGDTEFIDLLLGAGADPFARDLHGRTPLDWARAVGNRVLLSHFLMRLRERGYTDLPTSGRRPAPRPPRQTRPKRARVVRGSKRTDQTLMWYEKWGRA